MPSTLDLRAPQDSLNPATCALIVLFVGVLIFSAVSFAQESELPQPSATSTSLGTGPGKPLESARDRQSTPSANEKAATESAGETKHRGSIVVAPLPIGSPAIGTGIVPILGYIFPFSKNDKVSPPSTVGVVGLITNNGSRGFAVGGQLFVKQDTYEITSGYLHGNVDYSLYGIGVVAGNAGLKLPLEQSGHAFFGEVVRRLAWKFFIGPRFFTGD